MAYCVNCGVELAKTEEVCPLCGTPAWHPALSPSQAHMHPYPTQVERVMRRVDRRFFALLAALLLLLPVLICTTADLAFHGSFTWSVYVMGGALVAGVITLLPLIFRRPSALLSVSCDFLCILAYLLLIDLQNEQLDWFVPLGMPITISVALLTLGITLWFHLSKERSVLMGLGLFTLAAGLLTMAVEFFLRLYRGQSLLPVWSWFTLLPCLVFALGFFLLNRRRAWRENIRKRLFF